MDFIKWDQSFSVGVRLIDAQHQKLFALINNLYNNVKRTGGGSEESLETIILELAAYVDFHFHTEEKYFEEFHYEKTKEHTDQHHIYENKIREFNEKYKEKGEQIGEEVLVFLKDWLENHIKIKDKEYTKCFNDHGLNGLA